MQMKWFGHSCFLITAKDGTRILTDPCDPGAGYTLSGIRADVVTISHAHHDHNYLQAVTGAPIVIDAPGAHEACGIKITGISTYHDDVQGAKRGKNIVFIYEIDSLRIAHLGDLGAIPDDAVLDAFGKIDVLMCPVGGFYTIDAAAAAALQKRLSPRLFLPMHYKTAVNNYPIDGVDAFLALCAGQQIARIDGCEILLDPAVPGAPRILVLDYAK